MITIALCTNPTYSPLGSITFHTLPKQELKSDESGFIYHTDSFLENLAYTLKV